jgi:hypothetical protein
MKLLWAVALLMACGGSSVSDHSSLQMPIKEMSAELVKASQHGDVAAIRKLLGVKTTNGGLWFADTACNQQFRDAGEVIGDRLDEFARCLAGLKLQATTRREMLGDVTVLSYTPGFEVEARLLDTNEQGTWLSWIGYSAKRDPTDSRPTITPEMLARLRIEDHPPLELTGQQAAWIDVCIDATGTVSTADVRESSTLEAARLYAATAQTWHFKPFAPAGHALPVCALIVLATPDSKPGQLATMPPPFATPHGEPLLTAPLKRVQRGSSMIPPVDVMRGLQSLDIHALIFAIMYCVDEHGQVYGAHVFRSTGIPAYDKQVEQSFATTRYEPYREGGAALSICEAESVAEKFDVR